MKKESPGHTETEVNKKSFFSSNYKAAVIGTIIVNVFALILAILVTCTQRHEVYIRLKREPFYDGLIFYPFVTQIYSIVIFPFNYRHLVKTGKCERKLSRLVLPLIALALLGTVTILFVRLLYPF